MPRQVQRRVVPFRSTATAAAPALAIALGAAVAACSRGTPATPVPLATDPPTAGWRAVAPLPTDTATPLPSRTPPTSLAVVDPRTALAETIASLTAAAPPPVLGPREVSPRISCDVPRTASLLTLAPAADAPPEQVARLAAPAVDFAATVAAHDAAGRVVRLRPDAALGPSEVLLTYTGPPLPLAEGASYTFRWRQESDPGVPPTRPRGAVLAVTDADGLVLLAGQARAVGTAGAGTALEALSAGLSNLVVRQAPTLCLYAEVTDCGLELRAAPIEVIRGSDRVSVDPGGLGVLPGAPGYRVTVFTSHLRRWAGNALDPTCAAVVDWPQSWRVDRVAPAKTPTPTPGT